MFTFTLFHKEQYGKGLLQTAGKVCVELRASCEVERGSNQIAQIIFAQANSILLQIKLQSAMNIDQPRRSGLKTLSCLFQPPSDLHDQQETSIIPTLHSQKMTLDKQDEQELFHKVLVFLQTFFTDKAFHKEMADKLNKHRSEKYIGSSKQNQRILSFKKMNMGSRVCFDGEVTKKEEVHSHQGHQRVSRAANKKISIFVMEEANSESSEEIYSDDFISQTSVKTIRSIEIPQMEMNFQTIALIYESPQPFLINLSLCLFVRYCLATKHPVTLQRCAWVLTVATIVAYKLYYDEEIQGLIECFMEVLSIGRKDLIDLQRCFFEEIDYNTMISNYDYHFVLAKLLEMEPETQSKGKTKAP